jgi:hypothetical protein
MPNMAVHGFGYSAHARITPQAFSPLPVIGHVQPAGDFRCRHPHNSDLRQGPSALSRSAVSVRCWGVGRRAQAQFMQFTDRTSQFPVSRNGSDLDRVRQQLRHASPPVSERVIAQAISPHKNKRKRAGAHRRRTIGGHTASPLAFGCPTPNPDWRSAVYPS